MITNRRGQVIVRSDRTLHRYVITSNLGSGGFGEVFRARIIDLNLQVALKRFRWRSGSTEQMVANWYNEYTTHEALSHPNVLQSYDAFHDDGYLYIATELATNSLNHYIDKWIELVPPWDDVGVARAGMHIASALHYLHAGWRDGQVLIHRDVTPNNIFYFEDKNIFKLGDFGISKLVDELGGPAVTQVANWGFVAPELVREGFSVPQSDLFQLGLVLYSMAAGQYVVPKEASIAEKKALIASGAAWDAANGLEDIDQELKSCIKKLLLRHRGKRYASAAEVHAAMTKIYWRLRAP
ncbi:MAG TPA: serine/threonine-protein kinase [Sorangium sp.]|nr:serine/threonine-protein kinase [Sorangium sp.]